MSKKNISRPKASSCELCTKPFSFILKQHQCKRCLRAVCFECGKNKALIPQYDQKTVHRICHVCKDDQAQIQDLILNHSTQFSRDSATTKKWLRFISPNLLEQQLHDDYTAVLLDSKEQLPPAIKAKLSEVPATLQKIRAQYNFSMSEFDFLLTKDLAPNVIHAQVQSVLQAFLHKSPHVQLTQNLIALCLFLLYFHSQSVTFFILNYMREELVLQRYLDQPCGDPSSSEIDFLIEIGKKNLLIEACDLIYLRKFLEIYSATLLSNLFVNYVSLPCAYFLIDHLLKFKDIYEFEKAVVLVGKLELEEIKQKGLEAEVLVNQIVKNVSPQHFKDYLCKEDRIRLSSKRDVHSKSDDIFFQQFQEKLDSQAELKNILQMLDECLLKSQPMNGYHRQLVGKLHYKQQQIIQELLGQRPHKLSAVKEEQQRLEDNNEEQDTKGETGSEASMILKFDKGDLVEQNKQLLEEVKMLNEKISKLTEQRKQEHFDLEQVLRAQEQIKQKLEDQIQQQCNMLNQNDDLFTELDEGNKHHQECLSPILGQREMQHFERRVSSIQPGIRKDLAIQTEVNYEEIVRNLQEELRKQKTYYENKLQTSATKQQLQIEKILNDFTIQQQAQIQRSQTLYQQPVVQTPPASEQPNRMKSSSRQLPAVQPLVPQQSQQQPQQEKECNIF